MHEMRTTTGIHVFHLQLEQAMTSNQPSIAHVWNAGVSIWHKQLKNPTGHCQMIDNGIGLNIYFYWSIQKGSGVANR